MLCVYVSSMDALPPHLSVSDFEKINTPLWDFGEKREFCLNYGTSGADTASFLSGAARSLAHNLGWANIRSYLEFWNLTMGHKDQWTEQIISHTYAINYAMAVAVQVLGRSPVAMFGFSCSSDINLAAFTVTRPLLVPVLFHHWYTGFFDNSMIYPISVWKITCMLN